MLQIIDYILKNKEWMFSGIGVFALTGVIWLLRRFFCSHPNHLSLSNPPLQRGAANVVSSVVPGNWQGIVPPESRHKFVTKTSDSIPLGLQSFSFEYGPQGH